MHPKEWLELIEDTLRVFEAGEAPIEVLAFIIAKASEDLGIKECAEKLETNPRMVVRCFREVVNTLTKFNIFVSSPENVIYAVLKEMIESGQVDLNKFKQSQ